MSDTNKIRTTGVLDIEERGGPVEVCEHISLPSAYPEERDMSEYVLALSIRCEECDETYSYTIKVN